MGHAVTGRIIALTKGKNSVYGNPSYSAVIQTPLSRQVVTTVLDSQAARVISSYGPSGSNLGVMAKFTTLGHDGTRLTHIERI
ncbi:hypothetical protein CMP1-66 [Clavibacter phage CMP1]|uniref:Uncharacterized protein n=1 Tax=Clavibacter phage CMP1 TaxID=686439 RepID=D0U250_9CAUD|nr:hypothetical protein CMP1-66 [Clavibacter phage CMP1]ACY35958.1 hypothetical protein CMP1-66 [Clavibacter phage CMP1]